MCEYCMKNVQDNIIYCVLRIMDLILHTDVLIFLTDRLMQFSWTVLLFCFTTVVIINGNYCCYLNWKSSWNEIDFFQTQKQAHFLCWRPYIYCKFLYVHKQNIAFSHRKKPSGLSYVNRILGKWHDRQFNQEQALAYKLSYMIVTNFGVSNMERPFLDQQFLLQKLPTVSAA